MMKRAMKGGIIIETLIILAGLALLGKAISSGLTTYKFVHSTQGQITEGSIQSIRNFGLAAVIEFKAPQGETITFTQKGLFQRNKPQDPVPVFYDTTNPGYAAVHRFTATWFEVFELAIPGLILLIYGLRLRSERSL